MEASRIDPRRPITPEVAYRPDIDGLRAVAVLSVIGFSRKSKIDYGWVHWSRRFLRHLGIPYLKLDLERLKKRLVQLYRILCQTRS